MLQLRQRRGAADLVQVDDIAALAADDLLGAQRLWVTADSSWVTGVDRASFRASLEPLRHRDPRSC